MTTERGMGPAFSNTMSKTTEELTAIIYTLVDGVNREAEHIESHQPGPEGRLAAAKRLKALASDALSSVESGTDEATAEVVAETTADNSTADSINNPTGNATDKVTDKAKAGGK